MGGLGAGVAGHPNIPKHAPSSTARYASLIMATTLRPKTQACSLMRRTTWAAAISRLLTLSAATSSNIEVSPELLSTPI
jgi:hypothetical protein